MLKCRNFTAILQSEMNKEHRSYWLSSSDMEEKLMRFITY